MMKSLTIGKKLTCSFCVLLGLAAVLVWGGLTALNGMKASFDTAVNQTVKKINLSHAISKSTSDLMIDHRGTLLYGYRKDPATVQASYDAFAAKLDESLGLLQKSRSSLVSQDERELVDLMAQQFAQWKSWEAEDLQFCLAGDMESTTALGRKIVPLQKDLDKAAMQFLQIQEAHLASDKQKAATQEKQNMAAAAVIVTLLLIVGGGGFVLVSRVDKTLRKVAKELSQGSAQVAGSATQVSSSSQSLAQGASQQAASLQETATSAETIRAMTFKNADNSKDAARLMAEMAQQVAEGNRKLNDMVASMKEINQSSEKISQIIKTIDEIAFQTNILALNAAVEAARAGQAGLGFAVVADEVRNLALRCAQAARDTSSMIEDSVAKSHEGGRKLDEVAKSIGAITEGADKAKCLADAVQAGSQEQARSLEQISRAISQMEQVTQQTASSAEESASAGLELSAQSETLRTIIGHLAELVGASTEDTILAARAF